MIMRKIIFVIFTFCICLPLQGGTITALIHNGNTVISSCQDGFITFWDNDRQEMLERFQLTHYSIQNMIKNPLREELCIVEAAAPDHYVLSVWNYGEKRKFFSIHSREQITYINYSAQGNFIIAGGFNGSVITLINSVTGEIIAVPDLPFGNVSLAITGRAERNIMIYMSNHYDFSDMGPSGYEGKILYFDINSMSVSMSFHAPPDLQNPIIFQNNSLIAGVNREGLLLLSASNGRIIYNIENVNRNAILYPESGGFYLFNGEGSDFRITRYTVNQNGSLSARENIPLPAENMSNVNVFAYNTNAVFALGTGYLHSLNRGNLFSFSTFRQKLINEIAFTEDSIAFLTEKSELCFIPLNFNYLQNRQNLPLTNKEGYTHITPLSDRFILWQNTNTRLPVQVVFPNLQTEGYNLNFVQGRFPLRSLSYNGGRVLTLDSSGNISVYNFTHFMQAANSVRADFTFTAAGAVDAALISGNYFVVSRSIIRGSTPFLFVNHRTGETVPVSFPSQSASRNAGLRVFSGDTGNIYAAAIEQNADEIKTVLCNISTSGISVLFEYPRETENLSIAESGGFPAFVSGSEGAIIFPESEQEIHFERTSGLPVKVLGCDDFYLSLDSEGNIAWHDNIDGRVLAVFTLFEDRWVLRGGNREISGGLSR